MLILNENQIAHLARQDARARYEFSVKKIVDWEAAWALYDRGWVMAKDAAGQHALQLWPAQALATSYIEPQSAHFDVREVRLDDLVESLLPTLAADGITVALYALPEPGNVAVVTAADLLADLTAEASRY